MISWKFKFDITTDSPGFHVLDQFEKDRFHLWRHSFIWNYPLFRQTPPWNHSGVQKTRFDVLNAFQTHSQLEDILFDLPRPRFYADGHCNGKGNLINWFVKGGLFYFVLSCITYSNTKNYNFNCGRQLRSVERKFNKW